MYNHFETVLEAPSKYRKAINVFKNERGILPHIEEDNKTEIAAYHWLGCNFMLIGQQKESIDCYNELLKFASQIEDKKMEMNAYVGLGRAFSNMGDFESSEKYFLKALKMSKQHDDNGLLKETHIMLGNVYYTAGKFENALESYLEAQKILVDFGATKDDTNPYIIQAREISVGHGKKKDEANISFMLGDTFQQLKQGKKAIICYQIAKSISKELKDKEMQELAQQRLGISYLTSASVCRKDRDYERAIEFYKKALAIFETKSDYNFLRKKAITGLGVALFKLGKTEKAVESIQLAQTLDVKDNETGIYYINSII
jgi:tetratricopeptide (TPR) repeat protein